MKATAKLGVRRTLYGTALAALCLSGAPNVVLGAEPSPQPIAQFGYSPAEFGGIPIGAFTHDEKWLLAIHAGIQAIDIETGATKHFLPVDRVGISSAVVAPDGAHVLVLLPDESNAVLWNVTNGRRVIDYKPEDRISAAAFSPDGNQIVFVDSPEATTGGKVARVRNTWTGSPVQILRLQGEDHFRVATFSNDGTRIIAGHKGKISVFEVGSGAGEFYDVPEGMTVDWLCATPEATKVLFTGQGTPTQIYRLDIENGETEEVLTIGYPHTTLDYAPRTATLLVASSRSGPSLQTEIWDLETKQVKLKLDYPGFIEIVKVGLSSSGDKCFTTDEMGNLIVWSTESGKWLHSSPFSWFNPVKRIVFSPDGRSVLLGGESAGVVL